HAARASGAHQGLLSAPSWRTIIRVSLKRHARMRLAHPVVECEMQKDVGQQWGNYAPLWRALHACREGSIVQLSGCFQPPLNIQQHPTTVCVLPHRAHGERPVEIVEKAADVEVDDPVEAPAPLASDSNRLQRRLLGPVPIRVIVEMRFHYR